MALKAPRQDDFTSHGDDFLALQPSSSANDQALGELRRRIQQYEEHYNLSSEDLHQAVTTKQLSETLDVCDWLIEYSVLVRAESK